jgi:predicted metal-binding membrane protein
MNGTRIAVLTILVLLEKLSPASQVVRRGIGALLIACSVATLSHCVGT